MYVSLRGMAIIDFCCVSTKYMNVIKDFYVISAIYMYHMPISVSLKGSNNEGDDNNVFAFIAEVKFYPFRRFKLYR